MPGPGSGGAAGLAGAFAFLIVCALMYYSTELLLVSGYHGDVQELRSNKLWRRLSTRLAQATHALEIQQRAAPWTICAWGLPFHFPAMFAPASCGLMQLRSRLQVGGAASNALQSNIYSPVALQPTPLEGTRTERTAFPIHPEPR